MKARAWAIESMGVRVRGCERLREAERCPERRGLGVGESGCERQSGENTSQWLYLGVCVGVSVGA